MLGAWRSLSTAHRCLFGSGAAQAAAKVIERASFSRRRFDPGSPAGVLSSRPHEDEPTCTCRSLYAEGSVHTPPALL